MNEKKILVCGSIAYDYIMEFQGDLNDNLTTNKEQKIFNLAVMPTSKEIRFGGTSGNISYNLAKIAAPTKIVTAVGKDFVDLGYEAHMKQHPTLEFIGDIHQELFSASCYIVNDVNHNQFIIFHEGAMSKCPQISLKDRKISRKTIEIASISPDNVGAMAKWARELNNLGIRFILDSGQVTPAFTKEILEELIPKAFLVIGNEFEIQMIIEKLGKSLDELLGMNPNLIITKGDKGSELFFEGKKELIGICTPNQVIDTTGAGDAFRAGLLYGISQNYSLKDSCQIGATLSSFSVETVGPQTQKYSWADVQERYEKTFHEIING
ncbi:carbohydrate kinase family protein [Promethearchaeum syntrophicum]|uniref:Carbohydrate kinase family protein n=1 Tax=Promethearchaeum syntrophicum TaxID=2594042 RepID=A0A5B9D9G0_9ARCH|nr:carbohydrate kinase family protein [Candidatus Prometheoarchaeum syntrophicum]QEE15226.1 putative sugar kinase [Candidatus Prometheoarchaeum syntrophicum]